MAGIRTGITKLVASVGHRLLNGLARPRYEAFLPEPSAGHVEMLIRESDPAA